MCVIISLEPNKSLSKEHLENAVYNNPHGYGLILKDPKTGKIEVIKELPESKETNPKVIQQLLDKHKDKTRYLHLRFETKGGVSKDNLHPFSVYKKDDLEVWFMHNGTLYNYGDNNNNVSDSRDFNEKFLKKVLSKFTGDKGKLDYTDPVFIEILEKYWTNSQSNRGILISNKYDTLTFGSGWSEVHSPGESFKSSNRDYFYTLKRGPEYERRKKKEEGNLLIKNSSANSASSKSPWDTDKIHDYYEINTSVDPAVQDFLKKYLVSTDIWDESELDKLAYITDEEVEELVAKELISSSGKTEQEIYANVRDSDFFMILYAFPAIVNHVNAQLKEERGKVTKLEEKLRKSSNLIAELKKEEQD